MMTVEQAKATKAELEWEVLRLLQNYAEVTGATPVDVVLEKVELYDANTPRPAIVITGVTVVAEI